MTSSARPAGGKQREVSPLAEWPAQPWTLANAPELVTAYFTELPELSVPGERLAFGTSGHRGSSTNRLFTEWHILATSQAICLLRAPQGVTGTRYWAPLPSDTA